MLVNPNQKVSALLMDLGPGAERSKFIVPAADAGVYEVATATFVAYASIAQGDYFTIVNKAGEVFAVWFDKTDNGTPPSGAAYVASDTQIEVDIVAGDNTAALVAAKVKAAVLSALTGITVADVSAGVLSFTQNVPGTVDDPAPHNTGDTGAGSIVTAVATAGVAASLQSKYILLSSKTVDYYAWFNVGDGGTDPAVASRTGIEVAFLGGATKSAIATAIAAALHAHAAFSADSDGAEITVGNTVQGAALNAAAGDSGFTVQSLTQGQDGTVYPSQLVSSLSNEPALISEPT